MLVALGVFVLLGLYAGVRLAVAVSIAKGATSRSIVNLSLGSVGRICDSARSAWGWLDDPVLGATEALPSVGKDIQAVRTLARGAAQVCSPARQLLAGLNEKHPIASLRDLGVKRVRVLGLDLISHVDSFNTELQRIQPASLHFGLASRVVDLQAKLSQVPKLKGQLRSLVSVAAAALDSPPGSRWLIATQNLAEARGTGGILGSYAVVQIEADRVRLVEAGSDQTLAGFGPVVYSSLPVDTALTWGVEPKLWQDLNPSAHAPYTAQQVFDSWAKYNHENLAGVIFIGQGWAQNLVGLVGPLTYEGLTLDSTNTADFLAKGIYERYPEVAKKNAAVAGIMRQLASKLALGKMHFSQFIRALQSNPTGDKLFAWSPNPTVERSLVADHSAGYVDAQKGNRVWVSINNGGGNKLDAYTHLSGRYTVTLHQGTKSSSEASLYIDVLNSSPTAGLPPYVNGRLDLPKGATYQSGSNVDLVSVYLPIGAELTGFFVDGQSYSVHDAIDRGRELLGFRLVLNPNESQEINVTWNLSGKNYSSKNPEIETNSLYNRPIFDVHLERRLSH